MLKEKYEKVKEFVVDHKVEIAASLCVAVGGVALYKIVKSIPTKTVADELIMKAADAGMAEKLPIPKLDVGTIDDMWVDQWGTNLILNDVTVSDLGKLGEEFLKIDGITDETVVSAVVGLLNN